MKCPNCGGRSDNAPHKAGCLLDVLLTLLRDRGHDLSDVDISKVDTDVLWTRFGGPAADQVARELGLTPYPEEAEDDVSEAAP
jgi:hypothetical protein